MAALARTAVLPKATHEGLLSAQLRRSLLASQLTALDPERTYGQLTDARAFHGPCLFTGRPYTKIQPGPNGGGRVQFALAPRPWRGGLSDRSLGELSMTAFNVVRFRVKPGREQEFLPKWPGWKPGWKRA